MYSRSKYILSHEGPSLTASVEVRYREAHERSRVGWAHFILADLAAGRRGRE
jgi:hypothetical protein